MTSRSPFPPFADLRAVAAEVWHRDLLFAVGIDDAWRPAGATQRLQFDHPTLERLRRQLPVAQAILKRRFHEHMNRLTIMLNETPVPVSLFEDHTI